MITNMNAVGAPLLKLPEVLALYPVSRAGWYQGVKDGRYPAPVKLGVRSVAWRRTDVERLIASLGDDA